MRALARSSRSSFHNRERHSVPVVTQAATWACDQKTPRTEVPGFCFLMLLVETVTCSRRVWSGGSSDTALCPENASWCSGEGHGAGHKQPPETVCGRGRVVVPTLVRRQVCV